MGKTHTPVKLPASTGALAKISVPGSTFHGFAVHSVGGAAVVRFWDNASAASGTLLATVDLTAPGTVGCFVNEAGLNLMVFNGVWVEYVSGTVEGSVYVG